MIGDGPLLINQTKWSALFPVLNLPCNDTINNNAKNACDARVWLLEELLGKEEMQEEYDDGEDYDEDGEMSEDESSDPWEEDDFGSMVSSGHSSLTSTDRSPSVPDPPLMCPTYAPVISHFSMPIRTTTRHTILDNDKTFIGNHSEDVPKYTATANPDLQSPNGLSLVSAAVTGFTTEKPSSCVNPEKQQAFHHPDIVFIVELTWSDGRVNVVKRTYTDFCRFQYYLINEFVDVAANESPARLNVYLPVRRDGWPEDKFTLAHAEQQESFLLAESRELLLNQYVKELIELPRKISASPTVLTFFESRNSDPVPYEETVDSSRVNVTDQYILCWI